MKSRERVHAAIRGEAVDRTPLFFWINSHAGCRLMAEYRPGADAVVNALSKTFWKLFKMSEKDVERDLWRLLPLFHDIHAHNWANEYAVHLGSDILLASFGTPWRYSKFSVKGRRVGITDIYGVRRSLGDGIYPDMHKPSAGDIESLRNYRLPDPSDERLYSMFRRARRKFPDVSIAAEVWGAQDFTATSLCGMENFMMFLIDYPEDVHALMDRWTDYHVEVLRRSVAAGADIACIFDDYGYNNRPLISMKMWKEFTYPRLKRLIDAAHGAGVPAMLHSCGFQMPFLEHYAEAGLDALQSFQPAAGNDFEKAFAEYGNRIAFLTGIDTQRGEMMTAGELREEILKNHGSAAGRGRFILGTTHELQYTMPLENVRTIFDTCDELRKS